MHRGDGRFWARCSAIAALLALAAGCSSPVVIKSPPPGENTVELARAATAQKEWDEAASRWNELFLRNGPEAREACEETARALVQIRERPSAEAVLRAGVERWPEDAELFELHGDLLHEMGFRRAAEQSYVRAIEIDPRRASTLLALARVRMELGLEYAARTALERRIELDAACPETWYMLGEASASLGDYPAAFDAYAKAFAAASFSAEDHLRAASMYRDPNARRIVPDAGERAKPWALEAVRLDPQSTLAHYLLGSIAADQGDLDSAIESLRRAVETDPAYLPALERLVVIFAQRGERAETREMANRALALETDPDRRKEIERALEKVAEDSEPAIEAP